MAKTSSASSSACSRLSCRPSWTRVAYRSGPSWSSARRSHLIAQGLVLREEVEADLPEHRIRHGVKPHGGLMVSESSGDARSKDEGEGGDDPCAELGGELERLALVHRRRPTVAASQVLFGQLRQCGAQQALVLQRAGQFHDFPQDVDGGGVAELTHDRGKREERVRRSTGLSGSMSSSLSRRLTRSSVAVGPPRRTAISASDRARETCPHQSSEPNRSTSVAASRR